MGFGMARKSPDPVTVLRGHRKSVQCVSFHQNETGEAVLFSGDQEGRLRVWDLERRRARCDLRLYPRDAGFVSMKAFPGDGGSGPALLLTQGREGAVKCWDIDRLCSASGEEGVDPLSSFSSGCYNFCRFSPSSSSAAGAGATNLVSIPGSDATVVEVWNAKDSERLSRIEPPKVEGKGSAGMCTALCMRASAGGESTILWAGYEGGAAACWDLRFCAEPLGALAPGNQPIMSLDLDSTCFCGIAGTVGSDILQFKRSPSDPSEWRVEKVHTMKDPGVSEAVLRGDGRIFVSACWDGKVRVFDYKKERPLAVLKVCSLAYPLPCLRWPRD